MPPPALPPAGRQVPAYEAPVEEGSAAASQQQLDTQSQPEGPGSAGHDGAPEPLPHGGRLADMTESDDQPMDQDQAIEPPSPDTVAMPPSSTLVLSSVRPALGRGGYTRVANSPKGILPVRGAPGKGQFECRDMQTCLGALCQGVSMVGKSRRMNGRTCRPFKQCFDLRFSTNFYKCYNFFLKRKIY